VNEWQELDPYNLPPDILKPGAWEFEYKANDGFDGPKEYKRTTNLNGFIERWYSFRTRRPEGWEPSECPTCGSEDKQTRLFYAFSGAFLNTGRECTDPWHDQPKAPTHEEIMAPRYWKDNRGRWKQILAYHPDSEHGPYVIDGDGRSASWFINRESADIPPEGN